ncbi:hypothetical protein AZI85_07720 [Bdellovibrio bacteriovorus]|uniref:Lipoprotein n=1 Tax=Bdellovibrio bacteriovorus TaxID=959 RepID=A0A150WGH6_BDEBC|nr:hypothetical protein [Bdellovibrio bacteriovorus]KYG62080.1 hypothetical protein AZI85_07720 [Bdellovibrio bacteriovorus]
MIKFVQVSIFWMSVVLAGCTSDPAGYHVSEYHDVKFEDLAEDLKVPTKVWDMLEFKAAPEGEHAEGGGGEHGAAAASSAVGKNLVFSEVNVFLVEKNDGIVENKAVKLLLPKGGGTVDLSRYITKKQGSFFVGFEFPQFETATAKKVIFVSKARKRRLGQQIFGSGCNQFFDITDRFLKEMAGEGIKVNTTQERYVSVLGGTFFFSAQKDNDVYLAQVTFTHSEYSPLFCEAP